VSPDTRYAGFWRRLLAYLIDYFVIGVVELALYSVSLLRLGGDPKTVSASIAASSAAAWAYFALMESSPLQATLGKLAIGIRVADARGGPLTFRRASLRYWAKWLSSLTLMIGWLMAAFTPRRQALHDVIARSVVVRTGYIAPARSVHWDPTVPLLDEYWDGSRWVRPIPGSLPSDGSAVVRSS
jgi:uncharacterized RDD family membrane protein YckC